MLFRSPWTRKSHWNFLTQRKRFSHYSQQKSYSTPILQTVPFQPPQPLSSEIQLPSPSDIPLLPPKALLDYLPHIKRNASPSHIESAQLLLSHLSQAPNIPFNASSLALIATAAFRVENPDAVTLHVLLPHFDQHVQHMTPEEITSTVMAFGKFEVYSQSFFEDAVAVLSRHKQSMSAYQFATFLTCLGRLQVTFEGEAEEFFSGFFSDFLFSRQDIEWNELQGASILQGLAKLKRGKLTQEHTDALHLLLNVMIKHRRLNQTPDFVATILGYLAKLGVYHKEAFRTYLPQINKNIKKLTSKGAQQTLIALYRFRNEHEVSEVIANDFVPKVLKQTKTDATLLQAISLLSILSKFSIRDENAILNILQVMSPLLSPLSSPLPSPATIPSRFLPHHYSNDDLEPLLSEESIRTTAKALAALDVGQHCQIVEALQRLEIWNLSSLCIALNGFRMALSMLHELKSTQVIALLEALQAIHLFDYEVSDIMAGKVPIDTHDDAGDTGEERRGGERSEEKGEERIGEEMGGETGGEMGREEEGGERRGEIDMWGEESFSILNSHEWKSDYLIKCLGGLKRHVNYVASNVDVLRRLNMIRLSILLGTWQERVWEGRGERARWVAVQSLEGLESSLRQRIQKESSCWSPLPGSSRKNFQRQWLLSHAPFGWRVDAGRETTPERKGGERRGEERRGEEKRGEEKRGEKKRGEEKRGEEKRGEEKRGEETGKQKKKGNNRNQRKESKDFSQTKGEETKGEERRGEERRGEMGEVRELLKDYFERNDVEMVNYFLEPFILRPEEKNEDMEKVLRKLFSFDRFQVIQNHCEFYQSSVNGSVNEGEGGEEEELVINENEEILPYRYEYGTKRDGRDGRERRDKRGGEGELAKFVEHVMYKGTGGVVEFSSPEGGEKKMGDSVLYIDCHLPSNLSVDMLILHRQAHRLTHLENKILDWNEN